MGAAIHRADVIGKSKNAVGISINAPLQRCFNRHTILFSIHINNFGMQCIFFGIHIGDIFLDAALIEINFFVGLAFGITGSFTLIAENNPHSSIEIGEFAQTRRQRGVIKLDADRENLNIGLEAHTGACQTILRGRLIFRHKTANRSSTLKALTVHLALTANGDFHPFAQSVDHRHANTVKTTGNLVSTRTKLATGVQHGQHRFQRTLASAGVNVGGNTTTVIGDASGTVLTQHHLNLSAVAG